MALCPGPRLDLELGMPARRRNLPRKMSILLLRAEATRPAAAAMSRLLLEVPLTVTAGPSRKAAAGHRTHQRHRMGAPALLPSRRDQG